MPSCCSTSSALARPELLRDLWPLSARINPKVADEVGAAFGARTTAFLAQIFGA